MTNKQDQLQAEIKAKVKPGIKPSQLRKARSADDLPSQPIEQQIKQELATVQAQLTSQEQEIARLKSELAGKERALEEANQTIAELSEVNDEHLAKRLEYLNQPNLTGKCQLLQEQKEQLEQSLNLAQARIKNLQAKVNNSLANVIDKHLNRFL